jgi:hypothetical protein
VSGSSLIGLEAFIVLALVLGFGGWELYSLRRDRRRDEARRDAAAGLGDAAAGDVGDRPRADPPAPR